MENPGELIRRAQQKRGQRKAPPQPQDMRQIQPAPQFVPRHASYSALMRSHDRVSTRHIQDNR